MSTVNKGQEPENTTEQPVEENTGVKEEETTTTTTDTGQEETGGDTENSDTDSGTENGVDDLPPHWRKELDRARSDAAKYRTQLREAQDKLQNSKSLEEYESAVNDLTKKLAESERDGIIARYGISDDLARLVVGETVEEWEASAKLISERLAESGREVPRTSTPPAGGRGTGSKHAGPSASELAKRTFTRY